MEALYGSWEFRSFLPLCLPHVYLQICDLALKKICNDSLPLLDLLSVTQFVITS